MITPANFVYILLIHYFCDFVLLSRWMAENKDCPPFPIFVHVGLYSFVMWLLLSCSGQWTAINIAKFCVVNSVAHLITDIATSYSANQQYVKRDRYAFFVVVGLDQFMHNACLVLTAALLV